MIRTYRMKIRSLRSLLYLATMLSVSACASQFKHTLEFNPDEPIRVAVVPFVQVDEQGVITDSDGSLLVDGIPLLSAEVKDKPTELVRKIVQRELRESNLDILAPYLVNVELPHHGFAKPDGTFDLEKIYKTAPSQICLHALDCDAVLYGRITEWDRSYYGVQSVNSLGISLELKDARTGKVLFQSQGMDSESQGLSKGPTGYTSLVLEPIKGLDSEKISDLAENVVKKILSPLQAHRDKSLSSSPPPSILASTHDGKRVLSHESPLIVLMLGSPHASASFSIGTIVQNIPMEERSPGNYYGEYYPLASDTFNDQSVTVYLQDQIGRVSSRRVNKDPLSLSPR